MKYLLSLLIPFSLHFAIQLSAMEVPEGNFEKAFELASHTTGRFSYADGKLAQLMTSAWPFLQQSPRLITWLKTFESDADLVQGKQPQLEEIFKVLDDAAQKLGYSPATPHFNSSPERQRLQHALAIHHFRLAAIQSWDSYIKTIAKAK